MLHLNVAVVAAIGLAACMKHESCRPLLIADADALFHTVSAIQDADPYNFDRSVSLFLGYATTERTPAYARFLASTRRANPEPQQLHLALFLVGKLQFASNEAPDAADLSQGKTLLAELASKSGPDRAATLWLDILEPNADSTGMRKVASDLMRGQAHVDLQTRLFAHAHLAARTRANRPLSPANLPQVLMYDLVYRPWYGAMLKKLSSTLNCELGLTEKQVTSAAPFVQGNLPPLELAWVKWANATLRFHAAKKLAQCANVRPHVVDALGNDTTAAKQEMLRIATLMDYDGQCPRETDAGTRALFLEYLAWFSRQGKSPLSAKLGGQAVPSL